MECKHHNLLLVKSATTLNSVVILAIFCTIVYQHQQLIDLKGQVKISQDSVPRFTAHDLKLLSLLSLDEYPQWLPQKISLNAPSKDDRTKVWKSAPVNEERHRKQRSTDAKATSGSQRSSSRVNRTKTNFCSSCQKVCFERLKNPTASKV